MNEDQRQLLNLKDQAQEALSVGYYERVAEIDEAYVRLAESQGDGAYSDNYIFALARLYHWHKRLGQWTGDQESDTKATEYLEKFANEGGDVEKLKETSYPF
jgi:hypothetical protein